MMMTTASPAPNASARSSSRCKRGWSQMFREVYADPLAERTVVVIPGLSLDQETLAHIVGKRRTTKSASSAQLMLLRLPRTRVVFITSTPVDPVIIDYYLSLLSGIPSDHARRRLTLLSATIPALLADFEDPPGRGCCSASAMPSPIRPPRI